MKIEGLTTVNGTEDTAGKNAAMGKKARWLEPVTGNAGFTIIEIIVTIMIVAALATIALSSYGDIKRRVQQARCMEELRNIEQTISAYVIEKGTLPDTLNDLGQGVFRDPWGRPVVYVNIIKGGLPRKDVGAANNVNSDFDLYSKGFDNLTNQLLSDPTSEDDILRGADGTFMGLGINY